MLIRSGLLVAFTRLRGFFYQDVIHHPAPWLSVHGIFISRRWLVGHLQFLISLYSRSLSLMEHLRYRRVYCASNSLGVPGALDWRACLAWLLGASLVLPGLHSVRFIGFGFLSGGSTPSPLVILGHSCLACPWRSSKHFLSEF